MRLKILMQSGKNSVTSWSQGCREEFFKGASFKWKFTKEFYLC